MNNDAYVTIYSISGEKILQKKLARMLLNKIKINEADNYYLVSVKINNKIYNKKVFVLKK